MAVSDEKIMDTLTDLALVYRGSFPNPEVDIPELAKIWRKLCDRASKWLTDDILTEAVLKVIEQHKGRGFLPDWAYIREAAAALEERQRMRAVPKQIAADQAARRLTGSKPTPEFQAEAVALSHELARLKHTNG